MYSQKKCKSDIVQTSDQQSWGIHYGTEMILNNSVL